MFCTDVFMREPLRFFRGIGQNALALVAQRKVHRSGNLLPDRGATLNLFANGFDRSMRAQKAIGQGFVFAQQSQQQVLRLNIRRPELAGFVAREKDDAPCLFRITFEHITLFPLEALVGRLLRSSGLP